MSKFVAFVSGKGGTGKTTATLNVGQALVNLGKKVLLLDANLVTPNLALHLGFTNPQGTVNKFLRREAGLKDIIYLHESGLALVPASPSYTEFLKTNSQDIGEVFDHLDNLADLVLVDAPSGLGPEVSEVLKNCDEAVIVVNPTLSSIMDALKTIQLAKKHNTTMAGLLLNLSNKGKHELKPEEIEEILSLPIIANVRQDKKFRKALYNQAPLTYLYKRSKPAKEFRKMAEHLSLENA
ncbi:P-loop NTPase [Candidatus Woesearchaeota archaeon]|nr:P-loop NTPase [Candidatus Woesearchaeota archaeon]